MSQGYLCALHQQAFEYFCERCLQPVCKQCTVIGPHHTQIHSISKINIAYQKKVQQIKSRIDNLIQTNRQKIFLIISQLNSDIDKIGTIKSSIQAQNNKQKQRIISNLTKQYENNLNILQLFKQEIISKSNQINDLGYRYENLENAVEVLGSHERIVKELRELRDRTGIVIEKKVDMGLFTKELTGMRIDLKEIEALNVLYQQKLKILQLIMNKANGLNKKYGAPSVDYEQLLIELNKHLASMRHLVCNFCGLPFSFDQANKECLQNNTNINLIFGNNQSTEYCKTSPDTNKLGTHRHYFGQPLNPIGFYGLQAKGSFKVELEALLLKTKALSRQKGIGIKKQFKSNDKSNQGQCEKIVFDYILIEKIGLTEKEKQIIMTLSHQSQTNHLFFSYNEILEKLDQIDV